MVVLNRIYTRTGDDGTTALAAGGRRPKYDLRIEALRHRRRDQCVPRPGPPAHRRRSARSHSRPHPERPLRSRLRPGDGGDRQAAALRAPAHHARPGRSSRERDRRDERASCRPCGPSFCPAGPPPPRHCISPGRSAGAPSGGSSSSPRSRTKSVSPEAVRYLNRLSDLLFVASRYINDKGALDVLWVPGQNR